MSPSRRRDRSPSPSRGSPTAITVIYLEAALVFFILILSAFTRTLDSVSEQIESPKPGTPTKSRSRTKTHRNHRIPAMESQATGRWFGSKLYAKVASGLRAAFSWVTSPFTSLFNTVYQWGEVVWTTITGFALFQFLRKSWRWLHWVLAATPVIGGLFFIAKRRKLKLQKALEEDEPSAPPLSLEARSRHRRSFRDVPRYY